MTRLDSVIRRLQAQRDCLDWAAAQLEGCPGVVLELGLGNGRTYDHLRHRLPDREIYVFDRQVAAHPDSIPDAEHLYLGEFAQTLPRAASAHAGRCTLVHCDIGTGVAADNRRTAALVARALIPLLTPGALVVSDQPLDLAGSDALAPPPTVPEGRYFLYRYRG